MGRRAASEKTQERRDSCGPAGLIKTGRSFYGQQNGA